MELSTVRKWVRQLINDQQRIDGHDVFEFDSSMVFKLSEDFINEETIIVKINGETLDEANWVFDPETNQVTIDIEETGEALVKRDTVEIIFSYYGKYSDLELNGWIEGSLLFFTEFRHPKTFVMDDSDEENPVLTVENGAEISTDEGHIIALVTAININPDNINLRTPDITKTGSQNKSKKDQIAETITRWKRFVGSLTFLENNNNDCGC